MFDTVAQRLAARGGAHVLDVNVGAAGADEVKLYHRLCGQ